MKTLPLTAKDFTWVKMTPKDMVKKADEYITHKKKAYSEIKKILPENRTYLNTLWLQDPDRWKVLEDLPEPA